MLAMICLEGVDIAAMDSRNCERTGPKTFRWRFGRIHVDESEITAAEKIMSAASIPRRVTTHKAD